MKNPRFYPHERNRYFYGKLLTVRDFESEQRYVNDKRRMINRLLHGAGVVCGLQVVAVDDKTIAVETGMALDYAGREIVVASPVTQKLSMIDGFVSNDYAQNVYLCLEYDERGKEAVYSVAGSSTRPEESGEYNRIQESYRLFIREEGPDPAGFGFSYLYEDTCLLYNDEHLKIWQKCPRYVNPDSTFEITLLVEKTLQVSRVKVAYELNGTYITSIDGRRDCSISFIEPEMSNECTYEVKFPFRAAAEAGMADNLRVKQGHLHIEIGDKVVEPESDCDQVLQIIAEPIQERVLMEYQKLNLDEYLNKEDQAIYLARISLTQIGASYMIEKVEPVPFNEYAYNVSDLYKLGVMGSGRDQVPFQTTASAYLLEAGAQPRLDVRFRSDSNQFDFELGLPQPQMPSGSLTTGVAEIEMEANPKAGKSYFSDEIDHGLGLGPVYIVTALEESSADQDLQASKHHEQIFFGAYEVFQKSGFESTAPRMAIGSILYPERGTFRIGIRCQTTAAARVKIRWWAYK